MCIAFRQAMDVPHFTQLQMDVSIEKEMDGCGARVAIGFIFGTGHHRDAGWPRT